MTISVRKRQIGRIAWIGVAAFLVLHGLDLLITQIGLSYGAVEVNPLWVGSIAGGVTLQAVTLKMLVALLVGLGLMRYNVLLVIRGWLGLSSDRLFKAMLVGQFAIVCFVAATLYIQISETYMFV